MLKVENVIILKLKAFKIVFLTRLMEVNIQIRLKNAQEIAFLFIFLKIKRFQVYKENLCVFHYLMLAKRIATLTVH